MLLAWPAAARAQVWSKPGDLVTATGPTRSMGDVFPPGASARLLDAVPGADLRGFVVLMKDEAHARQIPHRCLDQGRAGNGKMWYLLKGDANRERDWIRYSEDQLLGVLDLPRKETKR